MNNTLWHVLGAGSIGCLFTHELQRGGIDVNVLLRTRPADPLRELTVEQGSTCQQQKISVSASAANSEINFLLVTTKAYDVLSAIDSVAHRLHDNTTLVLLANGLGFAEQVVNKYPHLDLYQGTTTEGAYRVADFHIRHAGVGATRIGAANAPLPPLWFSAWERAMPRVAWEANIEAALWHKFAINCAINPLTAIHRCANGQLQEQPLLKKSVTALCNEIALVSEALGFQGTAATIHTDTKRVIGATADNRSSMLQDVLGQRQTEIDYLNGHLARIAGIHGIPTPRNDALLEGFKHCGF